MDGQTDDSNFSRNEDAVCSSLSPIVEMDESSVLESSEELGENFFVCSKGDLKHSNLVEPKLNLETTLENTEERLSDPTTPPEVLRLRLDHLQNDFDELKEFTELERQVYHSDCIPREKVRSLEEDFASLNEKVKQLMNENMNYKNKMEEDDIEKVKLETELAKALHIQSEYITLVEHMKEKIKSNVECGSTISENELFPTLSFLENCGENVEEVSNIQNVDPFLNSLRDLDNLLQIIVCDKEELQDKVDNLQLKISDLSYVIGSIDGEEVLCKQSFKSNSVNLQELENMNKDLAKKSLELSISENKRIEAETTTNIVNNENEKLQNKIVLIISVLKNIVDSVKDDSDIGCFLTHEYLTTLENSFANYRDLSEISNILAVLEHIFHRLKNELKLKKNEENENLILKDNLEDVNKKIGGLLKELSKTKNKMDEMKVLLETKSLEKISMENELSKLKNCMTLDDAQTNIIFIIKYLEEVIDSWDEKSNIRDIVNALQESKDILNIFNMLMNSETQTMFSEVVMKWKVKLLLHDEENDKVHTTLQNIKIDIDNCESKNKELRIEVDKINQIVREDSKRVSNLEKRSCCTDNEKLMLESKSCMLYGEKHVYSEITPDEDMSKAEPSLLQAQNNEYEKLQKEINNFNKAIKSDDGVKKNYDLSEIETLLDSWDCSSKIQSGEFTKHLDEKLTNFYNSCQNSKLKADVFRIINKFKLKFMEFIDLNNQLQQTVQFLRISVDDYENKHKIYNKTTKDVECETDVLKENNLSENNNCENKKYEYNRAEEIKTVKKLMILEITSFDETEDKETLMSDSLEGLFCKLMQIIIKKEQEMSCIMQKQQKEEFQNFEQTIDNLNNKLKSQESWTNTLESENEKINNELSSLKSLNNSFENKLKSLSNNINNKTLEIDILKSNISDLTTKNDSLISKLDMTEEIINNYKQSISLKEKDVEKLNEEIVNKNSVIKHLELKLTYFDKQEVLENKSNKPSLNSLAHNGKGDSTIVGVNQIINESQSVNVVLENCPNITTKDSSKKMSDFGTGLSEVLRKETDFIKDMIRKGETNMDLSEFFSTCHEKLDILKDVILAIGSKVMIRVNELQTMQSTLEYKNKELYDLELSISKLYRDFSLDEVQTRKGEVVGHNFKQFGVTSLMNELGQMKSECISLTNTSEELEQSAKMGQNIIQILRDTFQIIIDENSNMTKLIHELRKCIEHEQEKAEKQKQKSDRIKKEKNMFVEKNSHLENVVRNLKLELSHIKREMFSDIDIVFPDKIQSNEKSMYINSILKQYSEDQKVYSVVTDDLRFFGYQCELMLSYIGSLEYKLYFAAQQQDHLVKENTSLKGQLSSQNIEMNRFINQLISKSPFSISTLNQALEVIGNIFSEYKFLKENEIEHVNENKSKQEKIFQQQKELTSLTKQNSSLKFELMKCEESIRKLRSEMRTIRSQYKRKENIGSSYTEVKQKKIDVVVQTEGTCCEKLQKKLIEQKEKLDILSAKLIKNEQLLQQSNLTSSPYNKQISHLQGALGQAKERIRQLHCALKQQESYNYELVETLKIHESCQIKLDKE